MPGRETKESGDDADCPPDVIEVRRLDDGSLDEVVADNCMVHLEKMGDGVWWLGVYKAGYRQVVWFTATGAGVNEASSEMDDWPDATEVKEQADDR